jgi:hypothetical protein
MTLAVLSSPLSRSVTSDLATPCITAKAHRVMRDLPRAWLGICHRHVVAIQSLATRLQILTRSWSATLRSGAF